MAGKSSWDQAKSRQKLGLFWRIWKKISQIIKDYFYLPFFLLIILWFIPTWKNHHIFLLAAFSNSLVPSWHLTRSQSLIGCIFKNLAPYWSAATSSKLPIGCIHEKTARYWLHLNAASFLLVASTSSQHPPDGCISECPFLYLLHLFDISTISRSPLHDASIQ